MRPGDVLSIPEYKCHKVVRAFKIARIDLSPQTCYLIAADPSIVPVAMLRDVLDTKNPSIGDYFVLYKDGYTSISPSKVFEDGYDLIKKAPDAEGVQPATETKPLEAKVETKKEEKNLPSKK